MRSRSVSVWVGGLVGFVGIYACVGEDVTPRDGVTSTPDASTSSSSSGSSSSSSSGSAADDGGAGDADSLPSVVTFGERPDAVIKDVTADTHIDGRSGEEAKSFGSSAILFADSAGSDGGVTVSPVYALLRFDLSRIPATRTVLSATLRVAPVNDPSCTTDPADGNLMLGYRLFEQWSEGAEDGGAGGATFLERIPGTAWINRGAGAPQSRDPTAVFEVTLPTPGEDVEIPLTELTRSWVATPSTNFGILLATKPTSTDGICLMSRSAPVAEHRPLLTVSLAP